MGRWKYIMCSSVLVCMFPAVSKAETMNSQNYSVEAGRVGSGQLFSAQANSENYSASATDNPTIPNQDGTDDTSASSDRDEKKDGEVKNKIQNFRKSIFQKDDNIKQDNSYPKEAITEKQMKQVAAKKIFFWWYIIVVLLLFLSLFFLLVIKNKKRK